MKAYLDILRDIYDNGTSKHPTRDKGGAAVQTKNATRGLPNRHLTHDLRDGLPLVTTRPVNWRGLVGELRCFLEGRTNNADFRAAGCHFWSKWARPDGDLGPVYGRAWRRGDQLQDVLRKLRESPDDRRMVVSAWLPEMIKDMVLPPCHLLWVVTPYAGRLNLCWVQRSCDFPIGVPYNIASYALLTHLLAAWAGMEPGTIDAVFCDAHIYDNQRAGVAEQLKRVPMAPPKLTVSFADPNDFFSWQCELTDYDPHGPIDFGDVEV